MPRPASRALGAELAARVARAVPGAVLTGDPVRRLPGTVSFVFPGTSGEAVLLELERDGVICSSGSACAAGSDEPSHVLTAIGVPAELAQTAVRFTLGAETTRRRDRGGRGIRRPGGVGGARYRGAMSDRTAIPADDDDLEVDAKRVEDEVAPEEELLEGWLPDADADRRARARSVARRRRDRRSLRTTSEPLPAHAFPYVPIDLGIGNSASPDAG